VSIELVDVKLDEVEELEEELLELDDELPLLDELLLEEALLELEELLLVDALVEEELEDSTPLVVVRIFVELVSLLSMEETLLSFTEVDSILLVLLPPMVNSQAVIVKARRLKVLNRKCLFFILFASIWLYFIIFAFY
jgi:hypothetical protein